MIYFEFLPFLNFNARKNFNIKYIYCFIYFLWLKFDSKQKKYSCKCSYKFLVKKIQIPSIFHINKKNYTSLKINSICIFITKHFYENLHKYFFVQNQILIIKINKIINIFNNKLFIQHWNFKLAKTQNKSFKEK